MRSAISFGCLAALLQIAPQFASACECIAPISVDDMRTAKHVTVVRVIGTGVPPDAMPSFGIANVRVLDRLRGDATPRRLRYSLGWCCPLRIEAGKTYIVFLDAPAQKNLDDSGEMYWRENGRSLAVTMRPSCSG
jgi:hypothetical protein